MEKIKTSRESESRSKQSRKKDWTPPSSLDAPAAPQGYAHRWIRTATMGFEDVAKVKRVNKPFARKIQILTVMEQRAKVMGKSQVASIAKKGKDAIRKRHKSTA